MLFWINVLNSHVKCFNKSTEEMVFGWYVFCTRLHLRCNCECNCLLIVFVNFGRNFKTAQQSFGLYPQRLSISLIYLISITKGQKSLIYRKNAMYYTSVVLKIIYFCSRLSHNIGQLVYITKYPVLDRTDTGSIHFYWLHPIAKSASRWQYITFMCSGLSIRNCMEVTLRCFITNLTTL